MNQIEMVFTPEQEKEKLKKRAQIVLDLAKKNGASACEVGSGSNIGLSVNVRMGDVETVEFNQDQSVGITVYFGQRKGSASTTDTSLDAIESTVEAACSIARFTEEDPCAGLASAEDMAQKQMDFDMYHPWTFDTEQTIELAKNCEQVARDFSPKISNSDGASVSTQSSCDLYANSHGFFGSSHATRHSISCSVIAQENNEMQRDYWYSLSRNVKLLQSAEDIGRIAAERTVKRLGSQKIKTMKTPVVFSAEVASSLLGHFISAIAGSSLYRKASFLIEHLGKSIFPNWVQIDERPHLIGGFASSTFDGDGVGTYNKHFIKDGVLENYMLGTYSSRKLGMKSTANAGGAYNLFMAPNAGGLDDLLAQMGQGLLVTELIGHGTNLVTGDYSRGAAGFWVKNGKIQYPVSEVTVAGNLKQIFKDLVAAGNDIDKRRSLQTGSLLINELAIAGH